MKKHRFKTELISPLSDGAFSTVLNITGNSLLMENHRGITELGRERIVISGSEGSVCLWGQGLQVEAMNRRQILIKGRIQSVELGGENGSK